MRIRERLLQFVSAPLKRWLINDAELDVQWIGLTCVELKIGAADLDADAIGQEALGSAPLILKRVSISGATLRLSMFSSPAFSLIVDGLHLEISPRLKEDEYWTKKLLENEEQRRLQKLAALDPEGAVEHSTAENQGKKDNFSSFFVSILATFLLSSIRIELLHPTGVLLSLDGGHVCSLSVSSLVVAEGTENSMCKGSLLGSAVNSFVNMRKQVAVTKHCSVSEVNLWFEVKNQRTQTLEITEGNTSAVLAMMLLLSCSFQQALLTGFEITVPDAVFGLNHMEYSTLLGVAEELQGPSETNNHSADSFNVQYVSSGKRSSKELWRWAVSEVLGAANGNRLREIIQASYLRKRYASQYANWLKNIGWKRHNAVKQNDERSKKILAALVEMEKQLPIEAVALARLEGRRQAMSSILSEEHIQRISESWLHRNFYWMQSYVYQKCRDVRHSEKLLQKQCCRNWDQTFVFNMVRGSLTFATYDGEKNLGTSSSTSGLCVKWQKVSVAYKSGSDMIGYSLVGGSLEAQIIFLSNGVVESRENGAEISVEHRWAKRVTDSFTLFSSLPVLCPPLSKNTERIQSSAAEMHSKLREEVTTNWSAKPWEHLDKTSHERIGSADPVQIPFFIAVHESSIAGYRGEEAHRNSNYMLEAGKIECSLKCSFFPYIRPLLYELLKPLNSTKIRTANNQLTATQSDQISYYFNSFRDFLFSLIPDRCLQVSVLVEGPKLRLLAPSCTKAHPNVEDSTTLTFDIGSLDFSVSPAQWKDEGNSATSLGNEQRFSLEKKIWLRRPPSPIIPRLDGTVEHDQFGNNVVFLADGIEVKLQKRSSSMDTFVIAPLTFTCESSCCRDCFSTLLNATRTVSVAAAIKIPVLTIDVELEKAKILMQVIGCYKEALLDLTRGLQISSGIDRVAEEPETSSVKSGDKYFASCLSVNIESVNILLEENTDESQKSEALTEHTSAGFLTVQSVWFHSIFGDGSCPNICSGLQDIFFCLPKSDSVTRDSDGLIDTSKIRSFRSMVGDKVMGDHLIVTLNGPLIEEDKDDDEDKSFLSLDVDVGSVIVTRCSSESLLNKSSLWPSSTENMRLLFRTGKDFYNTVLEIEGGLLVLQTSILVIMVNYLNRFIEYSSGFLRSSENSSNEQQTHFNRSFSLPQEMRHERNIPSRSKSTPQLLQQNDYVPVFEGSFSVKIVSFSLVLAEAGNSSGSFLQGLLFDITATNGLEMKASHHKIATSCQLTVFCLQHQKKILSENGESKIQVPQFGSKNNENAKEIETSGVENITSKTSKLLHTEHILEASLSLDLQRNICIRKDDDNAWEGNIALSGLDFALTTPEVQMLISIVTPLADISTSGDNSTTEKNLHGRPERMGSLSHEKIPDGAIVAIKDANEHMYLCVEENSASHGQYRLTAIWHYSIAGDRALFKVKYESDDSSSSWFSLLSLHAKNSSGEPYRIHYRPGSRLAEISSTNDGSWELWQCVPYRSSADDSAGEFDVYSGVFSNLVHLINRKSKQGIALTDGLPAIVKHSGNLKVKVIAESNHQETSHSSSATSSISNKQSSSAADIPLVRWTMGSVSATLLYETAGGMHLLPLIRMRVEEVHGLLLTSSCKTRVIAGCNIILEHFEAQSSSWLTIINPVVTDLMWSSRKGVLPTRKIRNCAFCKFKKVDVVVSELSLDACLFFIGVMDLAGPYSIKHSPVLVNRCQIENHTGVNVLCRFDREGEQEEGKVAAWQSNAFLMRHVTSRRGTNPAEVSTSVVINLEKSGKGMSSSVNLSLGEPGIVAMRTRLESFEGSRGSAPGPIVVVDISRQSQDGIFLIVSPMVKIQNATGLVLELRCRRPQQGGGGAVVFLNDGDIIDDTMGAFDALTLEGEMKKALLSFNVGNYLLSIRPKSASSEEINYEWSEDVKGAKAVRASGLFDKLQYTFKRSLKSRSLEPSFGSVVCKAINEQQASEKKKSKLHFLIRTARRQVPVTRSTPDQRRSLIAWQEQQELLLLPTLRVSNFLSSTIHVTFTADSKEISESNTAVGEVMITKGGGKASLYADLNAVFLVLKDNDHGLISSPIDISTGHKRYQELAKKGTVKDIDMEIDFKDGQHMAMLKVYRADDGVLELVIYTKYMLQNDSDVLLHCCPAKPPSRWQGKRMQEQWFSTTASITLSPNSFVSWFYRSNVMLMKRDDEGAQIAEFDLDALTDSSVISMTVKHTSSEELIQLGVKLLIPSQADVNVANIIRFAPRYTVVNQSSETICVCQDGFQEGDERMSVISPGDHVAIHAQNIEGAGGAEESGLSLRYRLREGGWNWSGRVCAASLGSFFIKLRRNRETTMKSGSKLVQFAIVDVKEEAASLVMEFRQHTREAVPYRIENRLNTGSISFYQKGVTESESLITGSSLDYAWDDLSSSHRLVLELSGTQACVEVNLDKIKGWKSFAAAHRSKGFSLQSQFGIMGLNESEQSEELLEKGYEVYADGPTRVLRVCQKGDTTKKGYWQSEMSTPHSKFQMKFPVFKLQMVEAAKQRIEDLTGEELASSSSPFTPFLCAVITNLSVETVVTSEFTFCQSKVQGLGIDIKWQGAPFAAMLRVHDQDRLNKTTTVFHAAFVLSNSATNPIQMKYSSILLQAVDLNIDEDTLMKLVPFYRTSLSTTSSSRQIYFERFEIHPIKIVASFRSGNPRADYTSTQETFRALLHTVIKLPSVKGSTVELNGVLLSHALLTIRQLCMKCAQHYSWYAMRAIYIARGSKLLPPGFASLFDDSAASSLDVFFDPSSGSIDLQGLTLGMFNLLSRGLRKKGQGGTSRYLGDLEKTVRKAGSNLVFAVVTQISDNVLKGAETNGFDGMVNGFRRGVLNVAMEPSVLHKAVVRGGSTRRIQLDHSVGTDEAYVEGYLQAMLDSSFKQDYLKVKVMEDQVVLKNLPPNSMLMDEIISSVKNFLIAEGLLAGETSLSAVHSMRLLRGEQERRLVPAVLSLGEQLLVIFIVRGMREYTKKIFHVQEKSPQQDPQQSQQQLQLQQQQQQQSQQQKVSYKRTMGNFIISSAVAYVDGRLCRHIPNDFARRIVSGFLLSFVE